MHRSVAAFSAFSLCLSAALAQGNASEIVYGPAGRVPRTVEQRLLDIASVKDFGAVGDGVTDDSAAIAAALAAVAGCLWFPAGDYAVQSLPAVPATLRLEGPGRLVTTSTHRRTWELGGSATTATEVTWYVDPNGNDANDGRSAAQAFRTIQRAIDQLPPVIRHTQTIQLSAGVHNSSDRPPGDPYQWARPSLIHISRKEVTARTVLTSSAPNAPMSGGLVIRGAGQGVTFIRSNPLYTHATVYVTGPIQVAFQDITFQAGFQPTSSYFHLKAHRGGYIEGVRLTFNAGGGATSAMLAELGFLELQDCVAVNGSPNAYAANADKGFIIWSQTGSQAHDDGTYGRYLSLSGARLAFGGNGAIRSKIDVIDADLEIWGGYAGNRVALDAPVFAKNSRLQIEQCDFSKQVQLEASTLRLKDASSLVPAGTEPLLLAYGSAFFGDGNVSLPASGPYTLGKGTISFLADGQIATMDRRWPVVELRSGEGARTACQLSTAGFGTGDRMAIVAGTPSSVQLVSGQHMDLPQSLSIGTGPGQFAGAELMLMGGKWRVVGLGLQYPAPNASAQRTGAEPLERTP